ncbi:hypothetical protein [Rugosimonospora africana]|nr:hypothetical protein [Rugosimonospora africana]
MMLLRRWRPPKAAAPIVLWLLGGVAYLLGWRIAAVVLLGLGLVSGAGLAWWRNRTDPWRAALKAQKDLPPAEREALKGYPSWW